MPERSVRERPQEEGSEIPPPLLSKAPWRTSVDEQGNPVHIHTEAHIRLTSQAGELALREVRIYNAHTNDVGFHYRAVSESPPECIYAVSVYVYPATQPLAEHMFAVRAEFLKRSSEAKPTEHVLELDRIHSATGIHESYTVVINTLPSFEQLSLYRRGKWFLKYRITFGPAYRTACEQRIFDAIAALQVNP
jgi:hypothetical protein